MTRLFKAFVLCFLWALCLPAAHAQAAPRVSYLGPAGTYTEEAARFYFPEASLIPFETVPEAIEAVLSGGADYAVIPQENTLGGLVAAYVDALLAQEGLYVAGEVILPIRQTLMGLPDAALQDIRLVCSHPQGLTQSARWRQTHLPDAETKEMTSTAAAASYVAQSGDRTIAAVAAPAAAELYGLKALCENVQLTDQNKTRFYVLSSQTPALSGQTRALFAAVCEASLIDDIIVTIHNTGLEFVTLHDRPEGSKLGRYHYILETENPEGITAGQLTQLENIPELRCLGLFDVHEKP